MFDQDQPATVFMPSTVTPAVVGSPGSPPPPPPPSQKKSSKKALLLSLVALFILGGGIITGLNLVSQQQDVRSRAAGGTCSDASSDSGCTGGAAVGQQCAVGAICQLVDQATSRCACINSSTLPNCPSTVCGGSSIPGSVECRDGAGTRQFCCPSGQVLSASGTCINPPQTICHGPGECVGGFNTCCFGTPILDMTRCPGTDSHTRCPFPAATPTPAPGGGGGGGTPCSCYCAGSVQCSQQNGTGTSFCGEGSCGFQKCSTDTSPCYIAGGGGGGTGGAPPPPKKVCGETCSVNTDCANAATPGVSVICRNGFCENADCPQGQTVYGANCTCGSNSRLCGQTCGATVGLCAEGICTYTGGPSCAVGAPTYCAGTLNGYQRLACVDRDQGNSYLKGPSGKTSGFTEAEIRASCSTGANCPVGGTTGRKSSCGGICQVDSDCRAPSGGGSAVCRSGICENTACPAGKTLAGSACLCAGEYYQTQQCGQPCYLGALCAPGQGICRYVNTGSNNCPWGWSQTYCVGTLNGFTHHQCAAGDTGNGYLQAPDGRLSGITLTELRQSCIACGDGIVQPGEDCDDGAANGTAQSVCNTSCKATNCSLATPAPSPTPQPTPTPAPLTAQCQLIKIFDEDWNALTLNELATFTAGDKVRFTVAGTASQGTFDQARFVINGTTRTAVTQKRPGSEEFYDEFTIPAGTTTFSVSAQLHHSTLGWF